MSLASYEVVGAGFGTKLSSKKITLGGESNGYHKGISKDHAFLVGKETDTNFLISNFDKVSSSYEKK